MAAKFPIEYVVGPAQLILPGNVEKLPSTDSLEEALKLAPQNLEEPAAKEVLGVYQRNTICCPPNSYLDPELIQVGFNPSLKERIENLKDGLNKIEGINAERIRIVPYNEITEPNECLPMHEQLKQLSRNILRIGFIPEKKGFSKILLDFTKLRESVKVVELYKQIRAKKGFTSTEQSSLDEIEGFLTSTGKIRNAVVKSLKKHYERKI